MKVPTRGPGSCLGSGSAEHPPDAITVPAHITALERSQDAIQQACQLFETVFHHPTNPVWWAWKYHQPPRGESVNLVARAPDGDELLGHVGAVVLPGRYAGRDVRMAHLTDVMVHPQARSGLQTDGLYGRLMAAMRERLQAVTPDALPLYAYGFPGRTPSRLGARLKLYRPLHTCQEYQWREPPGDWSDRLCRLRACADGPWPLDLIDRLWLDNVSQHEGPTVIKNGAYLQWRYASHPLKPYTLWLFGPIMGAPVGWIITRRQPKPVVVDVMLPALWRTAERWHRLLRGLARVSGEGAWSGWLSVPGASQEVAETMIVAVEFDAGGFHPDWPAPQFQPGDTDVF